MNLRPPSTRAARPAHRPDDRSDACEGAIWPASAGERPGAELASELRRRWRAGDRTGADGFLSRDPELARRAESAVELIYEEFCLREAAGEADAGNDLLKRFPQWAGPLRVMLDCHRGLLEFQDAAPRFPEVGDDVAGFRLVAELGRGSRGRAFLAEQASLARRRVVLKITPLDTGGTPGEHLCLARLQHTNIVPLYSAEDDAGRRVRVLCMPYFGRATLASLLQSMDGVPPCARTGAHVLAAIDQDPGPASLPPQGEAVAAPQGAARQMLASVSFVQAMCWVGACLADALQFAHERGVLHLDLKPSNVLLGRDGQPMLLDFHLARAPVESGVASPQGLGGTAPYMPPEQQAALRAVREARPLDVPVDCRADVYALGVMLYEALGGRLPVTEGSPRLRGVNPLVSVGLSDIVARCVAPKPNDRYADAAALAVDLRRHLTHQPLAGVSNRSIAERWHKWVRRRPAALRIAGLAAAGLIAAAAGVASVALHGQDRHNQALLALRDGERQLKTDPGGAEAAGTFDRGLGLLKNLPLQQDLRRRLCEQLDLARRLRLARELHHVADQVRVLYGNPDAIDASRREGIGSQCRAFWMKRTVLIGGLPPGQDADVSADLKDIAVFAAGLSTDDREASQLLDEVEADFGPSAVIEHERRNRVPSGGSATTGRNPVPPRGAWEHYALGRAFLTSGDLSRAAPELEAALRLDPGGRWPNFYHGMCAYRTGRFDDAVAAFSVCIGTAPTMAAGYYNRSLAYSALGRQTQASRDFDRAAKLDPAYARRGVGGNSRAD